MLKIISSLFILAALALPAFAELKPAEVAVIAARGYASSEGLAKYYLRARGIPADNLCLVDLPNTEVLTRDVWQSSVRPTIRKWLLQHDPQHKLRCLVTVYGVPLKIEPAKNDLTLQHYQKFLTDERANRLKLLEQVLAAFNQIAPGASDPNVLSESATGAEDVAASPVKDAASDRKNNDPAAAGRKSQSADLTRIQQRLETALQRAQAHIASLPENDQRARGQAQVQQLAAVTGGLAVLLPALNQKVSGTAEPNPAARTEFDAARGRVTGLTEARSLLEQTPPTIDRDALILAILDRLGGLIGTVQWLDQQIQVASRNETGASFDSELSLILWDDGYDLLRWQPNYLRGAYANTQLAVAHPTMMVARIDAPTVELAKKIIDTSIAVEKQGLRGKAYFDTRGVAKDLTTNYESGSVGDYDRALLNIAKAIKEQTDLETVLEESPNLFQPGACPDAALYCGWYSLGKYVDAFEWTPGAVAYHLASSEANTLRDPRSQAWCKKLLEDGVCATIGPVYEPYLAAFPRPDEFFALLLGGRLTLAECYYQTQPFNSWMMVLIGDPLYTPFKYRANTPPRTNPAATPATK